MNNFTFRVKTFKQSDKPKNASGCFASVHFLLLLLLLLLLLPLLLLLLFFNRFRVFYGGPTKRYSGKVPTGKHIFIY